jgi:hypothetical protein
MNQQKYIDMDVHPGKDLGCGHGFPGQVNRGSDHGKEYKVCCSASYKAKQRTMDGAGG